jgi:transposase
MSILDLKRLAKTAKNSRTRIRYIAVTHFVEGKSRADIARYLKVARGSVNTWVMNYLNHGMEGLQDATHYGRPPRISLQQQTLLIKFVEEASRSDSGGRLQAKDVQLFIIEKFNINYKLRNIYRLLHHLGFSWITSRSRHPKQNEEAQRLFKNLPTGNDPSHTGLLTTK